MNILDKNLLRKEILNKRENLDYEIFQLNSNIIIEKLKNIIDSNNYKNIMIFMDMKNEVQVTKLLSLYENSHVKFYIPKIFPKGLMKINEYNKNELVLHKFGYYESSSENYINELFLDLIIVPGVVFDINKNRIGFGGGYYDRFLQSLFLKHSQNNTTPPLTIAICHDFQLLDFIPSEEHDINPEIIITEKRIVK